ncbi:hypothetical protein ACHAXT_007121 [Thalassiosira profunda]
MSGFYEGGYSSGYGGGGGSAGGSGGYNNYNAGAGGSSSDGFSGGMGSTPAYSQSQPVQRPNAAASSQYPQQQQQAPAGGNPNSMDNAFSAMNMWNPAAMATTMATAAASGKMGDAGMMMNVAESVGKDFFDKGIAKAVPGLERIMVGLRPYFAVDNQYVKKKMTRVLVPFMFRNWAREEIEPNPDGTMTYALPQQDENAPDLYIPSMGLLTYVLLCAMCYGSAGHFDPEVIPDVTSKCVLFQILEVVAIRVGFYMMNAPIPLMDLFSYTGYKYLGLSVNMLSGLTMGHFLGYGHRSYYFTYLWTATAVSFFILKVMANCIPRRTSATGPKRQFMVLGFAGSQFATCWFVSQTKTGGAVGMAGDGENEGTKVSATSITGKILCGYQGWFSYPSDGSAIKKWKHWFTNNRDPSLQYLSVDMYPNTDEYDDEDLAESNIRMQDGSFAKFYSAARPGVVLQHFEWMKQYGIAGVFHHRFMEGLGDKNNRDWKTSVLRNVRGAAEATGRVFAVGYDLAKEDDRTLNALQRDWKRLVDEEQITQSDRYLRHNRLPVLHIYGLGFKNIEVEDTAKVVSLIYWLQNAAEERYRVFLIGGVPSRWRDRIVDSRGGIGWKYIYDSLDGIHPWHVGRWDSIEEFMAIDSEIIAQDAAAFGLLNSTK